MYFSKEVQDLFGRSVFEEVFHVRGIIIPASDMSEFGAFNKNMLHCESLFGVITEVAGGCLFIWASLLELVNLGEPCMADPQAMHDYLFLPSKTREMGWCNDGLDCVHLDGFFGVSIIPAFLPALFDERTHLREEILVWETK